MPYEAKAERKKREWLPLAEAVEYVATAEGYSADPLQQPTPVWQKLETPFSVLWPELSGQATPAEPYALRQIRLALEDGEIPLRWKRETWPTEKTFLPDHLFADDKPPPSGIFWRFARIFPSDNYAVLDQLENWFGADVDGEPGRRRQLLLLCSRVHELWPPRGRADTETPSKKEKPKSEQIRQVAREIYDAADPPPNINQAQVLIRKKIPHATKKLMEPILKEEEFVARRRPRGNPKRNS